MLAVLRVREWVWRGGRFRIAVMQGLALALLLGIWMGAAFYSVRGVHSAAVAAVVSVLVGAAGTTVIALTPVGGGWLRIRQVSQLPPSDRALVLGAVLRGVPVSDPRLAPGVLAEPGRFWRQCESSKLGRGDGGCSSVPWFGSCWPSRARFGRRSSPLGLPRGSSASPGGRHGHSNANA
jgi:hypothetical protein